MVDLVSMQKLEVKGKERRKIITFVSLSRAAFAELMPPPYLHVETFQLIAFVPFSNVVILVTRVNKAKWKCTLE